MDTILPQNNSSIHAVVTSHHIESVAQLAKEIWEQHYTPIIGAKQVEYMLNKFQSHQAIKDQMDNGFQYYLLSLADEPIGYCSIQLEQQAIFLSKIYIQKAYRGFGFGKKFMDFIKKKAIRYAKPTIRLTVNKHNSNSISAYHNMGFTTTKEVVFDIGDGYVMDDYELELQV